MHTDPEITLASASPRRRELLSLTGWGFSICSSPIPESAKPGEAPHAIAGRLARSKAAAARSACPEVDLILAADTMVIHQGEVLGKPLDPVNAVVMLQNLRGLEHDVITAIAIHPKHELPIDELCESRVPMRDYSEEELRSYVERGSPLDKAGAYGIQDPDFHPVEIGLFGDCYANVMGLPLCHLVRAMRRMGYEPQHNVPERCMQFTGYDCTIYAAILRGEL